MSKEIERKFLVSSDAWKTTKPLGNQSLIIQGYLNSNPERTVRVRIDDPISRKNTKEKAYITIKGKTSGISRAAFEYEIPSADAKELLDMCEKSLVQKIRTRIEFEGFTWEIDEFLNLNAPLVIAEIELDSEDQVFMMPTWLGNEVSRDFRYSNSSLARDPFSLWSSEEQQLVS